jgi:hypothetical protein
MDEVNHFYFKQTNLKLMKDDNPSLEVLDFCLGGGVAFSQGLRAKNVMCSGMCIHLMSLYLSTVNRHNIYFKCCQLIF